MICKNMLNESTYPLQSDCETRLIIFQFLVSLGKNEQMNHLPPEHEQEDKAILPNNSSRSWGQGTTCFPLYCNETNHNWCHYIHIHYITNTHHHCAIYMWFYRVFSPQPASYWPSQKNGSYLTFSMCEFDTIYWTHCITRCSTPDKLYIRSHSI